MFLHETSADPGWLPLPASGQLMPWDLVAQVQNKPFSIAVGLQNLVLQTANLVLTPIADLHLTPALDSGPRARHYQAFNALFAPLFTWVDNGPTFMSVGYRFTVVNTVNSILLTEQ